MKTPEEEKLYTTLQDIIDRSLYGKLTWIRINSTTFTWTKKWALGEGAIVTIKKIPNTEVQGHNEKFDIRSSEHYIFEVIETKTGAEMMKLSTEEHPDFLEVLKKLFEIASTNLIRKGVDFLKKALDETSIE